MQLTTRSIALMFAVSASAFAPLGLTAQRLDGHRARNRRAHGDGLHDDFVITSMMMVADPTAVRYEQRVAAGKATINGLSIAPKEETIETGKKLLGFRVRQTVDAIQASIEASAGAEKRP